MLTYDEMIQKHWESTGCSDFKTLAEGDVACLMPLMFTMAILRGINLYGYEDRWCYKSYEAAKKALEAWDGTGEPKGWHRHPSTGRRVDDNGNPYISF